MPVDTDKRQIRGNLQIGVVGQGDDGDYARNGELVKALYESTDGKSFTFKGEIFDSPVETG